MVGTSTFLVGKLKKISRSVTIFVSDVVQTTRSTINYL